MRSSLLETALLPGPCPSPPRTPALLAFLHARARELIALARAHPQPRVSAGDRVYLHLGDLAPGQGRISVARAREKLEASIAARGRRPRLEHDAGRAALPLSDAVPVVLVPAPLPGLPRRWQALVLDGNHETAACLLAGATTMPVLVREDLRANAAARLATATQARAAALSLLEARGDLHVIGGDGRRLDPAHFSYASVADDPHRGLISRHIVKVGRKRAKKLRAGSAPRKSVASERAATALFIKFKGRAANFLEFRLADAIYMAERRDPAWTRQLRAALASDEPHEVTRVLRSLFEQEVERGALDLARLGVEMLPHVSKKPRRRPAGGES